MQLWEAVPGLILAFLGGVFIHLAAGYLKPLLDRLGIRLWAGVRKSAEQARGRFFYKVSILRGDEGARAFVASSEMRLRTSMINKLIFALMFGAMGLYARDVLGSPWGVVSAGFGAVLILMAIDNLVDAASEERLLRMAFLPATPEETAAIKMAEPWLRLELERDWPDDPVVARRKSSESAAREPRK